MALTIHSYNDKTPFSLRQLPTTYSLTLLEVGACNYPEVQTILTNLLPSSGVYIGGADNTPTVRIMPQQ